MEKPTTTKGNSMTPNYYKEARTLEEIEEETRNVFFTTVIVDDLLEQFKSEAKEVAADLTEEQFIKILNDSAASLIEFAKERATILASSK